MHCCSDQMGVSVTADYWLHVSFVFNVGCSPDLSFVFMHQADLQYAHIVFRATPGSAMLHFHLIWQSLLFVKQK